MLITLMKIRLEIMLSDFAEKKETCFDYKNRIFQSTKNQLFQSGYPMLLVKIWQLFGSFKFCQNKTRNNAWRLRREKRNLF